MNKKKAGMLGLGFCLAMSLLTGCSKSLFVIKAEDDVEKFLKDKYGTEVKVSVDDHRIEAVFRDKGGVEEAFNLSRDLHQASHHDYDYYEKSHNAIIPVGLPVMMGGTMIMTPSVQANSIVNHRVMDQCITGPAVRQDPRARDLLKEVAKHDCFAP